MSTDAGAPCDVPSTLIDPSGPTADNDEDEDVELESSEVEVVVNTNKHIVMKQAMPTNSCCN